MKRSTGRCTPNLFNLLSLACKSIVAYHPITNLLAPRKVRWVDLLPPHVPARVPSNLTHYSNYYYSTSTFRSPRAATDVLLGKQTDFFHQEYVGRPMIFSTESMYASLNLSNNYIQCRHK